MKLEKSTTLSPEKILSFMVCLVRLSKGGVQSGPFWSLALEVRRPSFTEGGHALFSVFSGETSGEQRRLDVQCFGEACVKATVRSFDRQFHCDRGVRVDLAQDGLRPRNEV